MTQPDPNYVAADRPVNRRTAARALRSGSELSPVLSERMSAARVRNRLGPPLLEQLRSGTPVRSTPLPASAIVGAVVTTAGSVALFLAWLQSSPALGLGGLAGGLAGAGLMWRARRQQGPALDGLEAASPLLDPALVRGLDQAVEQLGPGLPEAAAERLAALKELIVRIANRAGQNGVDENFTLDDRHYLTECVRRYLPDTLGSYLRVPVEVRATAILDGGHTANDLLLHQLELFRVALTEREGRLAKTAAEPLMRQQRFLEVKSRR